MIVRRIGKYEEWSAYPRKLLVRFNMITVTYPDLALVGFSVAWLSPRKEQPMARTSPYRIGLTEDERNWLEATAQRYTSAYRDVTRAKTVLLAAEGPPNGESPPGWTPTPNRLQVA